MLPTGLTYSSLAKRFIPSTSSGTFGVGRSILPSCSKRVTRGDASCGFRLAAGACAGVLTVAAERIWNSTPVASPTKKKSGQETSARETTRASAHATRPGTYHLFVSELGTNEE